MVAKVLDDVIEKVLSLPVSDRIEIFERLRQNLRHDPQLNSVTEEERRILDERLAEHDADPNGGSPWEEVEARLEALLKDKP